MQLNWKCNWSDRWVQHIVVLILATLNTHLIILIILGIVWGAETCLQSPFELQHPRKKIFSNSYCCEGQKMLQTFFCQQTTTLHQWCWVSLAQITWDRADSRWIGIIQALITCRQHFMAMLNGNHAQLGGPTKKKNIQIPKNKLLAPPPLRRVKYPRLNTSFWKSVVLCKSQEQRNSPKIPCDHNRFFYAHGNLKPMTSSRYIGLLALKLPLPSQQT